MKKTLRSLLFSAAFLTSGHIALAMNNTDNINDLDDNSIAVRCAQFVLNDENEDDFVPTLYIEDQPVLNPLAIRAYFNKNRYSKKYNKNTTLEDVYNHIKEMIPLNSSNPKLSELNKQIQSFILLAEITRELKIRNMQTSAFIPIQHINYCKDTIYRQCDKASQGCPDVAEKMKHRVRHILGECICNAFPADPLPSASDIKK